MGPKSGNEAAVIGRFWRDRNEGRIGLPSLSRSGQMVGRGLGRGWFEHEEAVERHNKVGFFLAAEPYGADGSTTIGSLRALQLQTRLEA